MERSFSQYNFDAWNGPNKILDIEMAEFLEQLMKLSGVFLIALYINRVLKKYWFRIIFANEECQNTSVTRIQAEKIPPVFPNGWYVLAESKDVPKGKVLHVEALGQNFAVFRGENRLCNVLDAYCPHLGANLAVGGDVIGNCVRCPFHHWSFDGATGECKTIPYSDTKAGAKVKRWESNEMNGFIYVWYHVENEQPNWIPASGIEEGNGFTYLESNRYTFGAHIQDVVESLRNPVYLNNSGSTNKLSKILKQTSTEATWMESKHASKCSGTHSFAFFDTFYSSKHDYEFKQLGPSLITMFFGTSYGVITVFMSVTPRDPLKQQVIQRIYCPCNSMAKIYGEFVGHSLKSAMQRDMPHLSPSNRTKDEIKEKLRGQSKKFRDWFNQFYSLNSLKYSNIVNIDW